jgi:hypothetical protein
MSRKWLNCAIQSDKFEKGRSLYYDNLWMAQSVMENNL